MDKWTDKSLLLLTLIAQRTSQSRRANDIQTLMVEIEQTIRDGEAQQSSHLVRISQLAIQLYGPNAPQQRLMIDVSSKHQHTLNSLREAVKELSLIRDIFAFKEQVQGQQSPTGPPPQGDLQQMVLQFQRLIEDAKAFKSTANIALGVTRGGLVPQGSAALSVPVSQPPAPINPANIIVPLRAIDVFEGEK